MPEDKEGIQLEWQLYTARRAVTPQAISPENIIDRYHQLVDRKYLGILTEAEAIELDELSAKVDEILDDMY